MCDRMRVLRVTHTDTQALCVHPAATGLPGRTPGAIITRASELWNKRIHDDKDRRARCTTWTTGEEAILLAHLGANRWSCSNCPGKLFTVRQGGGEGGGVHHSQYGGGKQDVRQDACAESDTY
jgi:hypothetical protein